MVNLAFYHLVGDQVSDIDFREKSTLLFRGKSGVVIYPNLSQDEVYFLRCGKEACGHSLSTVARHGMVTPCV